MRLTNRFFNEQAGRTEFLMEHFTLALWLRAGFTTQTVTFHAQAVTLHLLTVEEKIIVFLHYVELVTLGLYLLQELLRLMVSISGLTAGRKDDLYAIQKALVICDKKELLIRALTNDRVIREAVLVDDQTARCIRVGRASLAVLVDD